MTHNGMLSALKSPMAGPQADQRPCWALPVISFRERQPSLAAVRALSTVARTLACTRMQSSTFVLICFRTLLPPSVRYSLTYMPPATALMRVAIKTRDRSSTSPPQLTARRGFPCLRRQSDGEYQNGCHG